MICKDNLLSSDYEFKVKVHTTESKYRDWACNNIPRGTWKEMLPIMGAGSTFQFKHEEDLLVFKLTFGL